MEFRGRDEWRLETWSRRCAAVLSLCAVGTFVAGSQAQQFPTWDGEVEISFDGGSTTETGSSFELNFDGKETVTYWMRLSQQPIEDTLDEHGQTQPLADGKIWWVRIYVDGAVRNAGLHKGVSWIPSVGREFNAGIGWKGYNQWVDVTFEIEDRAAFDANGPIRIYHEVWATSDWCPLHDASHIVVDVGDDSSGGGNNNGGDSNGGDTNGGDTNGGDTNGGDNNGGDNNVGDNSDGGTDGNNNDGNTGGGGTGVETESDTRDHEDENDPDTKIPDDETEQDVKDPGSVAPPTVPGAPINLTASPGDSYVRLNWMAPEHDGGSPVLRYQYQQAEAGGRFGGWIDIPDSAPNGGNANTFVVTGLRNGETYTFRVRAENSVGHGPASNSARATPTARASLDLSWLARFGRTVADQVTDAIDQRSAPGASDSGDPKPPSPATNLGLFAPGVFVNADTQEFGVGPPGESIPSIAGARSAYEDLSTRDFLLGKSFQFSVFDNSLFDGAYWTVWGRSAGSRFAGGVGERSLDGDVLTGLIGADMAVGSLLGGIAVSHTLGEGEIDMRAPYYGRADVEATLTSVHPYARYTVSDRLSVWASLGYGEGEYREFDPASGRSVDVDIDMKLGVLGTRSPLLSAADTGWYNVALKSDAFWMQLDSDSGEYLEPDRVETTRLRLGLEGWLEGTLASGGVLRRSVELALRHDGGDAEVGSGVQLGGRLRYTDSARGFAIEAAGHGLLVHEDEGYRDWGVGISFQYDPCVFCLPGFGPSIRVSPSWGTASSQTGRLWSALGVADLMAEDETVPGGRLDAELSYGMGVMGDRGLFAPYVRMSLADRDTQTMRVGGRLSLLRSHLRFNVEGMHREYRDGTREQRLMFNVFAH